MILAENYRFIFIKEKSVAFTIFKYLMVHVEVESGYKIKILRSDRGGEYTLNEFRDYCRKNSIKQQFTTT